jgi:hypothetical protein
MLSTPEVGTRRPATASSAQADPYLVGRFQSIQIPVFEYRISQSSSSTSNNLSFYQKAAGLGASQVGRN